jgi:uncharacterized protein (TIGR02001 family)
VACPPQILSRPNSFLDKVLWSIPGQPFNSGTTVAVYALLVSEHFMGAIERYLKMRKSVLAAGALLLLFVTAAAADKDLSFGVSSDFYGKYIWRGQNISNRPVFQPGLNLSWRKLTLGIWGNMDLTNINGNSGDFSELDYSLGYSDDFPGVKGLSYSVGVIYYNFPGTAVPDTTEVYWGLGLDVLLNPTFTFYQDVDEAHGTYVNFGISHSIDGIAKIGDTPIGLEFGAGLGWANSPYDRYYWGVSGSKMQDLSFSVGFPVTVAGWSVKPSLNYVTLVSDSIRGTNAYSRGSDYFFGGVSLSKTF